MCLESDFGESKKTSKNGEGAHTIFGEEII